MNNIEPICQDANVMREMVLNCDCPFCDGVGFKNIALHISKKHGITRRELSDMIGFSYSESICSKELSDRLSEDAIAQGRNPAAEQKEKNPNWKPSVSGPTSKKGKEISAGNLEPWFDKIPKKRLREISKKGGETNRGREPWNKTHKHGTRAMYLRGCKCEECASGNSAYWVAINKKRRGRKKQC